jgi:alcohol dehydrogenase class IV
MDFNFFMPVKVISGIGCLEKGGGALKSLGNRCLIVTGSGSAKKSGALDAAVASLKCSGIDYFIFDKIEPNPLLSTCFEAGITARKFRADFILGIGGGSPLDAAKAAAVFACNSSFSPEDIFKVGFSKALPIALVGTTAGTGSEVTATSVLTIDSLQEKKSVTHPSCYAAITFADPAYTYTCPYELTVSAALDALCHAVEGYFSARAGDIARESAIQAVKLLWQNLLKLSENPGMLPDETSREQLYYGSLWAGVTLNLSGTGYPHPAGYPLTTELGIPHGKACAVFMPDYIRHNAAVNPALTTRLFNILGFSIDRYCDVVSGLAGLNGIKLTDEQCARFAETLRGRANLKNALNPSTVEEVLEIYKKLFS